MIQYHCIEKANHIYSFIINYVEHHLYSPSYAEIRANCALESNTSVIFYLNMLAEMGYISYIQNQARSISLLLFDIDLLPGILIDTSDLSIIDNELYLYIASYIIRNKFSPSYEEIVQNTRIGSKSTLHFHLQKLQDQQLLFLTANKTNRTIHLNYYYLKESMNEYNVIPNYPRS